MAAPQEKHARLRPDEGSARPEEDKGHPGNAVPDAPAPRGTQAGATGRKGKKSHLPRDAAWQAGND